MIEFILYGGIMQSLLLGFFFLFKRKLIFGGVYQSILLFLIAFGIWIGSLYNSGKIFQYINLSRVGFLIFSLIGGFFYISTRTVLEKTNRLEWRDGIFFLLPLFITIYLIPFFISSYEIKLAYLTADFREIHFDCYMISLLTAIHDLICVTYSIYLVQQNRIKKRQTVSFYIFILIFYIPFLITFFYKEFINSGFCSFLISILVILRGYQILYNQKQFENPDLFSILNKEKYEKSRIKPERIQEIGKRIESYFNHEKPFLDPDFSSKHISENLQISSHTISQVMIEYFQKSFYQLLNEFRLKEVIRVFDENSRSDENILQIAFSCGFNSKSTFNDSFKKFTGKTPRDYKKSPTQ